MSLSFKYATHKNGFFGEPRGFVVIEGLEEGQELTTQEALNHFARQTRQHA